MRIPRALLWSLVAVALVAGGALWWVYASRDALIKQAIERRMRSRSASFASPSTRQASPRTWCT